MTKGLLLTMTEPPAQMEEEFNAWYDSEHLPERLSISGFHSARRWIDPHAPAGSGKYLATYELDSPQALQTPEYLAHVGDHFTPWSKRCLSRCLLFRRWACAQVFPGDAPPDPAAQAVCLTLCDVPEARESEFNRWQNEEHLPRLLAMPGVLNARRFRAAEGGPAHVTLLELADAAVQDRIDWTAAMSTPWAQRVAGVTPAENWKHYCYEAYEPKVNP
jgi:hypothetical protein